MGRKGLADTCMKKTMAFVNCLGHKAGGGGGSYIDPKKFGRLSKPCMKETAEFLNCLALNNNIAYKCVQQKDLLMGCMDTQAVKNKRAFGGITYHLHRLNKGKK